MTIVPSKPQSNYKLKYNLVICEIKIIPHDGEWWGGLWLEHMGLGEGRLLYQYKRLESSTRGFQPLILV